MSELPVRAVVARIAAVRDDARGTVIHTGRCPFCRAEAVDADGEAAGCVHLRELELGIKREPFFLFESAKETK